MNLHFHIANVNISSPELSEKVFEKLDLLTTKISEMSQTVEQLRQEVAENKTVIDSAVTLLQNIKQRLDEAGTDATALQQLRDDLDSNTNALAAAVEANTPAEQGGNEGEEDGANTQG